MSSPPSSAQHRQLQAPTPDYSRSVFYPQQDLYRQHDNRKARPNNGPVERVCPHCSYKSTGSSNFQRHLLTHSDYKPFACKLCPFRTRQKIHLQQHVFTHTGEKPYKCSYCDYCANQKHSVKLHEKKHH